MHKARNRLLALLAANSGRDRRYEIKQAADEATIYLYDVIDPYWGVSASNFVKDLNALTTPVIHLRINSPGGDVFDGRAIATAISQHPSKIVAHIDGLAASAASYVAIAAAEVEMAPGSFLMIHRAWTLAFGNAGDIRKTADVLDKIDESLVATYSAATGKDPEQIREWLDAETWFTAEEAVTNGFADRVAEDPAAGDSKASARWDLTAYSRAPSPAPAPPLAPVPTASANDDEIEAAHAERQRRARLL